MDAMEANYTANRREILKSKAFVDAYKWDRQRTIEAAREYQILGKLPCGELKAKMSAREFRRLRAEIEAEPDIERYRRKLVQLYLYLTTRSQQYRNAVARDE
jgi:hypothetical protein